jgi:choice-of-anchor B domain-containing protein
VRSVLLLIALAPVVASPAIAQIPTRNMQVLGHVDEYHAPINGAPNGSGYSACWGYKHPDGREYAVIGTWQGTAIYNITNPAAPFRVAFLFGPPSTWREMKQYRNWMYVVTEATGSNQGLQIVRMTDPDHPEVAVNFTSSIFVTAHTVSIDTTRALLYLNGTRSSDGQARGMQIYSLAQPEAPAFLAAWPFTNPPVPADQYIHDSVPFGNRLYASSIYIGTQMVFDVTNPAQPVVTTSWTYPSAYYTHNAWPDSLGTTLYVTDEQNGQTLRVFDIANLQQPHLVTGLSSNPNAIVHNAVVNGHELYLANYTEGVRVLDLTDPHHPAEFGWADTYPGGSGGFGGVWGVCPMPSGTVIASDRNSGLWLLRPQRNYGRVRVQVVDAATQQPLAGVTVRATPLGDTLATGGDGIVQFAPGPGMQQFRAERFGWTQPTHNVMVNNGSSTSFTFELEQLPTTSWDGVVTRATDGTAISDADVVLTGPPLRTRIDTRSNAAGQFHFDSVPENDYQVEVHRPGHIPVSVVRHVGIAFPGEDFTLTPAAHWDSLETATGWTVGAPGDAPSSGAWVRVAPVGTEFPAATSGSERLASPARMMLAGLPDSPDLTTARTVIGTRRESGRLSACGDGHRASTDGAMCGTAATVANAGATGEDEEPIGHCGCGATCICSVAPNSLVGVPVKASSDRTPGSGTLCFVTGQSPATSTAPDDVDLDGRTSLTSPAFDLSSYSDPRIGYWRWFFARKAATGQPDDTSWLAVLISSDNGTNWTTVDTLRGMHNAWEEATLRVRDFVTPTATVRLRFVANDLGSTTDAAIDDLTLFEGTTALGAPGDADTRLRFAAPWPNPSADAVRFALQTPRTNSLTVEVVDLRGALVRRLHHGPASGPLELTWDGRDARGHAAPAGVYFAVARSGAEVTRARLVRLP